MTSRLRARRALRATQTAVLAGLLLSGTALTPVASAERAPLYRNPRAPVPVRVADLMKRMSLDDKIGQMTEGERAAATPRQAADARLGSVLSGGGSVPDPNSPAGWADMIDGYQRAALATPLGIPTIYGADTVHGHNNVHGATIFPHNIGLGAANDPRLVERIGAVTANESAATGVKWGFAPCLCVARDDRWGRTYESYGELPRNAVANSAIINGLQGRKLDDRASVLATAKHFIGDGGTAGGVDQGDARISERELREIHLPPFRAAIARGVGSVMVSYNSWNGVKDHGNKYLITDLLKGELRFSGFVVSDYNGIDQIGGGTPGLTAERVAQAINAGIDMAMVPNDYVRFIGLLKGEVAAGHVPMSRIDDANRRILTKKFELGLFEHPYTDRSLQKDFGSGAHRELARQAVRESQVLLKNDGVLPLKKNGNRIFVAGKNANDIGNQAGGWTLSWQGRSGPVIPGTTILDGLRAGAGKNTTVTFDKAGNGIDKSYKVAVAVVGETPYAEGKGDRPNGLGLDAEDLATIAKLKASGVPLVVVTVSGRVLDLGAQLPEFDGLVAAWLPGSEGAGVADVLYGDYDPTGRLSFSWPKNSAQEPINAGDGKQALFPYGYGLSYRRH
ncbi:glycoside hydrolase family 3 protein [Amycolatopsis samaneae]|uniref:beta-glucosidase n=1 Tax=Amycolatopsis samaneae TaxID=664691 RepID=A0ABW5GGZ8_9PSEU